MVCVLLLACPQSFAAAKDINSKNASIVFMVDHDQAGYTIGSFDEFSGSVEFNDEQTRIVSAKVTVATASVNTQSPIRDEGLRSPLFFDAEKFPQAVYENGALTLKGVTKPVALTVEQDKARGVVVIRGSFDRNDFGITYNKLLAKKNKSIGDKVELVVEIPS